MVGSYRHYKLGNLKIQSALVFAVPSIFSLLLVRKTLLPLIPDNLFINTGCPVSKSFLIMLAFALLMITASVSMIRESEKQSNVSIKINFTRLALIGLLVGMVTGFLGAGGGFLIIPALLFFAGLPMKQAVGTSLLIIFINSLIGFSGDLLSGIQINYMILFTVAALAISGMFIGTALSTKINGKALKPAFGWFVLLMGLYIVFKEVFV
jgi:hypothetical protein